MKKVHNRMTVILTMDETEFWLQNDHLNTDSLKSIFKPYKGLITLKKIG